MPSSCKDIRDALALCLQHSDCIMVQRHSPSDCLRPPLCDELPLRCQQLKKGYAECKKGMIDMRKRFRGNKPVSMSVELEGGGGVPVEVEVPMLYAGKPALGKTAGVSGEEQGKEGS